MNPWRYGWGSSKAPYDLLAGSSTVPLAARLVDDRTILIANWSNVLDGFTAWQMVMGPSGYFIPLFPLGTGIAGGESFPFGYDVETDH